MCSSDLRGLILSNGVSVFGIFLLRQAFGQIPAAAVEAARMDGAGHFTVLRHIALPMARPNVITFMLLAFIGTYNSYMWPSLITDTPEKSLISQGLRRFLYEGGAYGTCLLYTSFPADSGRESASPEPWPRNRSLSSATSPFPPWTCPYRPR